MKKDDTETKENIEKLGKVIEQKKKIPKNIKEKISSKRLENLAYATIVLIYLISLNLGMLNIPTENYLVDLRVFSMMLLVTTIVFFEIAYKKDVSNFWIHGVEIMGLAIFTVYLIYMYSIFYNEFSSIIFSMIAIYAIYYVVKMLIMKRIIIKKYNKSLIDIGDIVKKGN